MNKTKQLLLTFLIISGIILISFGLIKKLTPAIFSNREEKNNGAIPQNLLVYRNFDCIPPTDEPEIGWVTDVIDGDSIRAEIKGESVEIRYIGINTPEYYSEERDEAEKATIENISMVEGKKIYLFRDTTNVDKYQRLLRYVFTDNLFINYELVNRGFAEAKAYPPNTACQSFFELSEK